MTACEEIDASLGPRLWRVAKLVLFCVTEGAAVLLIGFAALFVNFQPAWSASLPPAGVARPGDAKSGSLLLKREDGYTDAIRIGIDVDVTVSGPTMRARVTQLFWNPTRDWVEAVYVYPLPPGAAVDTLKMVVGDRVVVGEIKERQQARIIYEQAKRDGQKAALTEQERPNLFTNSVANIGPGETVLVQIEYQEPVHQTGNVFSLRVPMVVAPRYNPAPIVQSVDFRPNGGGWGATASDPVPDRDRITPPVLDPREQAPVNPTAITVRLQAGFALGAVKSHHHQVNTEKLNDGSQIIRLAEGVVPADRDFELTWTPAAEKAPSVGLFREHVGDADYLLAYVTPPSWADTWPVARIEVKRIGASAIVLSGSSGQALAFGPGHVEFTAEAGERGVAVYSAHRDTHFRFLKDVTIGDEIEVTRRDGKTFRYRADSHSVVRFDQSGIDPDSDGHELILSTCWPLDAVTPGPDRYLLRATLIETLQPYAKAESSRSIAGISSFSAQ